MAYKREIHERILQKGRRPRRHLSAKGRKALRHLRLVLLVWSTILGIVVALYVYYMPASKGVRTAPGAQGGRTPSTAWAANSVGVVNGT